MMRTLSMLECRDRGGGGVYVLEYVSFPLQMIDLLLSPTLDIFLRHELKELTHVLHRQKVPN